MNKNDFFWFIYRKLGMWCLNRVRDERGYEKFHSMITDCNIDLLDQYTENIIPDNDEKYKRFYITKLENEHAFQTYFTEKSIKSLVEQGVIGKKELVLVDIGDSAGSHIKYLKRVLSDYIENIHAVSVNLDPVAVKKIRKSGGEAVLCRAEEYKPDGLCVDVYLSYEMVEHLHNPALFFYKLARTNNGKYMVVTVPYREKSGVALKRSMDQNSSDVITAEKEHIFELCPDDWKKLIWHAGWKTMDEEIYYQYPKNSILSPVLKRVWNNCDFEGFYAMFLERDMTVANRYKDWEE